jgi:methylated-DNA-[protein]-cysteine S-methyltransferase
MKKYPITLFQKSVYEAVRLIPRGKVSTYQRIAQNIGRSRSARAVGNALNRNPFAPSSIRPKSHLSRSGPGVPCHRVVRSDGLAGGFVGGTAKKIRLLKKEGVRIKKERLVDFTKIVV